MKVSINSHNMSGIGESFPEHIKHTTNEAVDKYYLFNNEEGFQ